MFALASRAFGRPSTLACIVLAFGLCSDCTNTHSDNSKHLKNPQVGELKSAAQESIALHQQQFAPETYFDDQYQANYPPMSALYAMGNSPESLDYAFFASLPESAKDSAPQQSSEHDERPVSTVVLKAMNQQDLHKFAKKPKKRRKKKKRKKSKSIQSLPEPLNVSQVKGRLAPVVVSPSQPSNKLPRRQVIKLNTLYRPSIVTRPQIINLTSLLKPGQVLLSKKLTNGKTRAQISTVSPEEVRNLLSRLKPMSVSAQEEPPEDQSEQDGDDQLDDEPDRILPTSHLFGGSVGIVNEDRISAQNKQRPAKEYHQSLGSGNQEQIMQSLSDFSSQLGNKAARSQSEMQPIDDEFADLLGPNDNLSPYRTIEKQPEQHRQDQQMSIPVETLVDHLLSSSRRATFGVQHEDVKDPQQQDEDDEQPPDEDEDDEEDDANAASESRLQEVQMLPPKSANLSFSSILNNTDSWIPLDSISSKTVRQVDLNGHESWNHDRTQRKDSGLVIGDRVLNRLDLVRLIRVLNKMASKREPSKERAASRKLLKFLIKLALNEHRKEKLRKEQTGGKSKLADEDELEDNSKMSTAKDEERKNDPIHLLRSILMSPVNMKDKADDYEDSIEMRPVKLRSNSRHLNFNDTNSAASNDASSKPGTSLGKMSEELENYFDKDFFEDLADKVNNSSSSQSAKPKRRAASRTAQGGYSLPVPIFGQQTVDGNPDEDDSDKPSRSTRKKKPVKRRSDKRKPKRSKKTNRKRVLSEDAESTLR